MNMHLQCEEGQGKREGNINTEPLTFLHVTQIIGNGFKGFFSRSVHSDSPSLTSFN